MKEQVSRIAKQPNFSSILTAEDKLVVIGGGNSDDFIDDLKVLIVDLSHLIKDVPLVMEFRTIKVPLFD